MRQSEQPVKARRRYDASRRQEHARQARDRIIDVARRRFLAEGYAATSIASVADEAGISVDTIYKTFGGKAGLLRAVFDRALEGTGPEPAEDRSDRMQRETADPRQIIAGWGRFVSEIAPRAAPLFLLLRSAAATDPQLDALIEEIDRSRLERMTINARRLHQAGHLRPGITAAHAADVLWTYSSAELYELLVVKRKMSVRRYGTFVADAMIAALL